VSCSITAVTTRPAQSVVDPTFVFDVRLRTLRGQELPLGLTLEVRTEDKRLVGLALLRSLGRDSGPPPPGGDAPEQLLIAQLVLPVTPTQISYIDAFRWKHEKPDVILECRAEAQLLVSGVPPTARRDTAPWEESSGEDDIAGVVAAGSAEPRASRDDQIEGLSVFAADGERTVLFRKTVRQPFTLTISGSDWQNEYVARWSPLGLGKSSRRR
jgi:hypothetical protein